VLTTDQSREIQELYRKAKERDDVTRDSFLSRYAGGSVFEYFAEGANALESPRRDGYDPREVVRDLNAYFTEMETAIRAHGGLVLQYIGDEIEAVFGAPVARPRHAEQAVRAALDMRARLADWNAGRARAGRTPLRNGIGIHTGRVLAGNIGSADRLSYALVGDAVNLASRLQGLTKELKTDVVVSGTTRAHLDDDLPLTRLPAMKVKGRTADVEVYALG